MRKVSFRLRFTIRRLGLSTLKYKLAKKCSGNVHETAHTARATLYEARLTGANEVLPSMKLLGVYGRAYQS